MKSFICFLFLLFVSIPSLSIAQQSRIDSLIGSQMAEQRIMGLSLGIVKNGKVILAKGYGKANVELDVPASEQTAYKIGSLSKQFIAAAIMKLVQEGKLKLADPVGKYIKQAPAKWTSITIRNLLNHSSGVPVEPPGFDGMKEQDDSVYIKAAFGDSLRFRLGSRFEYSNFGYFILADIIRITTTRPFSEYMKNNIFETCGMTDTRSTSIETIVPNRAAGYITPGKDSIINAPNYLALRPSGAFLSTITDMLKWEMVMQNNQLLTQQSWRQMWTDTVKTSLTMDGENMFYGYGWMTNKVNGKPFVHHGGSLPGFKSVYFRYLQDKTAIIILTNSDNADLYGIAFGVSDLLAATDKR